jgi:hypothetical protein
MANLVTNTDTARWIACLSSETRANGDVVEIYYSDGKAMCRKPTGAPGCDIGVVENNTNNSLSTIPAGTVGDVQVDGTIASAKKDPRIALVSGDIVDYVINEVYCTATAGLGPKNLLKLSASAGVTVTTCAGTLASQIRKEFNSLITL